MEEISADIINSHVQNYAGNIDLVLHEEEERKIRVDLLVVPPNADFDFYTIVSSGASYNNWKIMCGESGLMCNECGGFIPYEVYLCLPKYWGDLLFDKQNLSELPKEKVIPFKLLEDVALWGADAGQCLKYGHTVPEEDNSVPFAAYMLLNPILLPKKFGRLNINESKDVAFYSVIPLFKNEYDYVLSYKGTINEFEKVLVKSGITEIYDPMRESFLPID